MPTVTCIETTWKYHSGCSRKNGPGIQDEKKLQNSWAVFCIQTIEDVYYYLISHKRFSSCSKESYNQVPNSYNTMYWNMVWTIYYMIYLNVQDVHVLYILWNKKVEVNLYTPWVNYLSSEVNSLFLCNYFFMQSWFYISLYQV